MRPLSCWRGGGPLRQHVQVDDGMVIAEAAVVIPVLVVVAFMLAWGVSLVGTSIALADAARQVARDVARGVDIDPAVQSAASRAPDAVISVEVVDDSVSVIVRQEASAPVPLLTGLRFPLTQSVVVPREWT